MSVLNTDVYGMTEAVSKLCVNLIPEEAADTLSVGLYGGMNAIATKLLTTTIRIAAENANEVFPARARFEKNVVAHAITNNIEDINAVPAVIPIYLCLKEESVKTLMNAAINNTLIIDRNTKFFLGDYEYHLDFDIWLTKQTLINNISVYTARYNMDIPNRLSDVSNPYLPSPYVSIQGSTNYIFLVCQLRQVGLTSITRKIITNNFILNKTYEFEFTDQLATFDVIVTDNGVQKRLTPIFKGADIGYLVYYCYYTYLNPTTIRVEFDPTSYSPSTNTIVTTEIMTTLGATCNFEYKGNIYTILADTDTYSYNSLEIAIIPAGRSDDGKDKKSVAELKRIIPKEALSRGIISTNADLQNYFNTLNTSTNRLSFKTKVDNQNERSKYGYLLLKDDNGDLVPTNTINLKIKDSQFNAVIYENDPDNKQYVLRSGSIIGYKLDGTKWMGEVLVNPSPAILAAYQFIYTIPYKLYLHNDTPRISYFNTNINESYLLNFSYINNNVPLQFIGANILWNRSGVTDINKYKLKMSITQNIASDMGMLKLTNGVVTTNNMIVLTVFKRNGEIYRYFTADLLSHSMTAENYSYVFETELETDDVIDTSNDIKITNGFIAGEDMTATGYGFFNKESEVLIYVLAKFTDESANVINCGRYDLDDIVDGAALADYSVTNIYSVVGGVIFYDNFSEIVSTIVSAKTLGEVGSEYTEFTLTGVPVVKYSYGTKEENVIFLTEKLKLKKAYIEDTMVVMENQFGIDFKFYNTYGPARIFTYDKNTLISRVNISPVFNISLKKETDEYTMAYIKRDIKAAIEDLNNLGDYHFPNLISDMTKTYANSINFIEFKGYNGYGTGYSHIYNTYDISTTIPEFVCVNVLDDGTPDITLSLV